MDPDRRGARRPCTIQVFAKAPRPGRVKTRLEPALGARQAAELACLLVERTLCTAARSALGPLELWCSPDANDAHLRACASRFGAALREQSGFGLGQRMRLALSSALSCGNHALLIGTDCPALDPAYLCGAAAALESHDAVLGPAEDGGYVLIGMARELDCFHGVRWGGAQVLSDTHERLRSIRARWLDLPMLWDIDTPENLPRLADYPALARFARTRSAP